MRITIILLLTSLILLNCGGNDKDDPLLRLKYVNRKYLFSIRFPENWINYSEFETDEIIDQDIIISVIYFTLPTRSRDWQPVSTPHGFAELFSIMLFTPDQWKIFEERYGKNGGIRLNDRLPGKSEKFVYMIRFPRSLPVDLYIYMKETTSVVDTFRILKKE